ncbi:MAG: nucleotidyltransferase domain-containing protein [Candidatus Poribacteria bacterium]
MKNLDSNLLNEIVQRLVDALHPEKIYLFGSHAYGQPNDDSDVDLFIVVNDSDLPPRMKAVEGYRALSGILVPAEIKVATQSIFERRSHWLSSIERVVAEKGKLLYESRA